MFKKFIALSYRLLWQEPLLLMAIFFFLKRHLLILKYRPNQLVISPLQVLQLTLL